VGRNAKRCGESVIAHVLAVRSFGAGSKLSRITQGLVGLGDDDVDDFLGLVAFVHQ
jgi:hypothetical protein